LILNVMPLTAVNSPYFFTKFCTSKIDAMQTPENNNHGCIR
jgi:hypothetical protein